MAFFIRTVNYFSREVSQATALWEKYVAKRKQSIHQDPNENSENIEKSSDDTR
jgi:hypothetical protein